MSGRPITSRPAARRARPSACDGSMKEAAGLIGERSSPLASLCQNAQFRSIVPVNPLAPLVTLLGLDRKRGDRPGLEALQRDRVAGLFAIAIGAVVNTVQRSIDFGDQLPLAVAGPELDGPVGFG